MMIWYTQVLFPQLVACSFLLRNLLPISHVCTEDGEKPMVLLPFMAWGNLKQFLRQCKLAEANNPQVRLQLSRQTIIKSNIKPPTIKSHVLGHAWISSGTSVLFWRFQPPAPYYSSNFCLKPNFFWKVMSGDECLVFSYDQAVRARVCVYMYR